MLAIAVNRIAGGGASTSAWLASGEEVKHAIPRHALPFIWDFGESNCLATASRSWDSALNSIVNVLEGGSLGSVSGQVQSADTTNHPLPDQSAGVWFTDPPYYDAIPYADLADFFLIWLKRTLPDYSLLRDSSDPDNPLSPKAREIVQDETKTVDGRPKDRAWFEEMMAKTFAEGRRILSEDGVGSVVFAHKTTEGWEALLSGMIRGGWTITGSWPLATEMPGRLRSQDSAALATSVHLICRPRPEDAPIGDWADVLRELPIRVADWIERLQAEGIRGADLVFACIGPALEIFSRYRAVETAEGDIIGLPDYLEKVWEVVGRAALQQVLGTAEARARNGLSGALEEDARLTALFLWTLQSTTPVAENQSPAPANAGEQDDEADEEAVAKVATGFALPFDVVRRFAQPMGIDLDTWTDRVIGQEKGRRTPTTSSRARQKALRRGRRCRRCQLHRKRPAHQLAADTLPRLAGRCPHSRPGAAPALRRILRRPPRRDSWRHHPRPRPHRHAASVQRPRQRAADANQRRARSRPRLPPPCQRPIGTLPSRLQRKTPARRHVVGGAEVRTRKEDLMDQITLKNFRCFRETQTARLAPLTLLVGENSTGKTSFMAMIRALWDMVCRGGSPDFKEDPYDLGSFDEIAHFRGGRGGRAATLEAGFEGTRTARTRRGTSIADGPVRFEVTFEKREPSQCQCEDAFSQKDAWMELSQREIRFGTKRGTWKCRHTTEFISVPGMDIPLSFI